jgi:hypothetical protein
VLSAAGDARAGQVAERVRQLEELAAELETTLRRFRDVR